jgi:hypothetical protein
MKDRPVRRHKDAAVFFHIPQTENMVILIDGAAHCTQRVMAVRQYIGNRKPLDAAGSGRLKDIHIIIVRRYQSVKFQLQPLHIPAVVMGL